MRSYDDPEQHFSQQLRQAADRYVDGLNQIGLQPNEKLVRRLAERAAKAARVAYEQQANETLAQNTQTILHDYARREKQIRHEGALLSLKICPPIVLLLGIIAWFDFHQGDIAMGLVYSAGAFVFFVLLVVALSRR